MEKLIDTTAEPAMPKSADRLATLEQLLVSIKINVNVDHLDVLVVAETEAGGLPQKPRSRTVFLSLRQHALPAFGVSVINKASVGLCKTQITSAVFCSGSAPNTTQPIAR